MPREPRLQPVRLRPFSHKTHYLYYPMTSAFKALLTSTDHDELLDYVEREGVIDGHRRVPVDGAPDALDIIYPDSTVRLDHERALVYLHGLVRAFYVGTGALQSAEAAPEPPTPNG